MICINLARQPEPLSCGKVKPQARFHYTLGSVLKIRWRDCIPYQHLSPGILAIPVRVDKASKFRPFIRWDGGAAHQDSKQNKNQPHFITSVPTVLSTTLPKFLINAG